MFPYRILLDETDKRRPLDFNGRSIAIVQSDYKVEKITFPQITRRLLLEMRSSQARPGTKEARYYSPVALASAEKAHNFVPGRPSKDSKIVQIIEEERQTGSVMGKCAGGFNALKSH